MTLKRTLYSANTGKAEITISVTVSKGTSASSVVKVRLAATWLMCSSAMRRVRKRRKPSWDRAREKLVGVIVSRVIFRPCHDRASGPVRYGSLAIGSDPGEMMQDILVLYYSQH